ncbi:GTPase domain-containing protein [Aquisalimonas sp.]|uniref:GTP-binding protein n=1 Tax=Aquisalimonas sp. TaxID=1872621 RepID=UPI0025BC5098|nr:GTPase domain-containing protein [Aquisalimonas sp.]
MADYDASSNRVTLKVVYYGPALSGKTTNVVALHDMLSPQSRGEIMMFETRQDRTLFFDLLPVGFRTRSGMLVKLKLYTVPGQVAHDSTRKAVLSRADGVCFVADSAKSQSVNNAESFENLEANCRRVGLDFERLPLVIQFNKRDLPDPVPEKDLRDRWSAAPWPLHMATALTGQGVQQTFLDLMARSVESVARELDDIGAVAVTADEIRDGFLTLAKGR